jgi:hypothetical protein
MTSMETFSENNRCLCRPQEFPLTAYNVGSNADMFYLVDRNIHGTGASINNMKKQKHTQHTLLIYF